MPCATAKVIANIWLYGRPRSAAQVAWDAARERYGEGRQRGRKAYKRLKAALDAVREYD